MSNQNIHEMSRVPVFAEDGSMLVTSPFGWRVDPFDSSKSGGHSGVDITRWTGYSNYSAIAAFADGIVVQVKDTVEGFDPTQSEGNFVVIDHGGGWISKYFHMRYGSVCVKLYQRVTAGEEIGYMGTTGYSTGAHLHFQLERDGVPVDPLPYLLGEKSIAIEDDDAEYSGLTDDCESCGDNTPSEWAAEAVQWCRDNGIIYGDGNDDLKLRESCTREMMCVFLKRLFDRIMSGG